METEHRKIAVIGLGYVGLPLAIEFGKKYRTLGFDINAARVAELQAGKDHTLEANLKAMKEATDLYKEGKGIGLSFACYPEKLKDFKDKVMISCLILSFDKLLILELILFLALMTYFTLNATHF